MDEARSHLLRSFHPPEMLHTELSNINQDHTSCDFADVPSLDDCRCSQIIHFEEHGRHSVAVLVGCYSAT